MTGREASGQTQRHLRMVPPLPPSQPRPEPVDGSVVRFVKSGYGYVAVRSGAHWETSATSSTGFIDEIMTWPEMWDKARYFELATAMEPVRQPAERDKRLIEESVICFTIADQHWAAIVYQGAYTGFKNRLWYTTLTQAACKGTKLNSYGLWADVMRSAQNIHVVTSWKPLLPWRQAGRGWWEPR